jgi:hypothetical protein
VVLVGKEGNWNRVLRISFDHWSLGSLESVSVPNSLIRSVCLDGTKDPGATMPMMGTYSLKMGQEKLMVLDTKLGI